MKKFIFIVLTALAFITAAISAAAADRGTLSPDVREFGAMVADNDYDEWVIDLLQDGNLTIRLTPGGSEGTDAENLGSLNRAYISLLDSDKYEIYKELFESLPFIFTEELKSGIYYARIERFADDEVGSYYIQTNFQNIADQANLDPSDRQPDPELAQTGTGAPGSAFLLFAIGVIMVAAGVILIKGKPHAS